MKMDTIIVTAYAKAPQNTGYYETNKYVGVVLEIDKKTEVIVDASITFMTETAINYFKRLVIGTNMAVGIPQLLEDVRSQYFAPSTQSLITALKTAHQRYCDIRSKKDGPIKIKTEN